MANNNVVPGTSAPAGVDPTSLIPAAHLPGAVQTVAQSGRTDPNVLNMLKSMQAQINALMGGQQVEYNAPDVVMVNPGGRLVEVTGELANEYLSKPGFRKATEEEEINYRKAMLRQTPQYLRRLEKKRLQDEASYLDELELEDASGSAVSNDTLLRTKVTDAQKTGALEPADMPPADPAAGITTGTSNPDTAGTDNANTPVPSRRGNKAKDTTGTSNPDTNKA